MVSKSEKTRLIAIKAVIWTCPVLTSFILPLVFDSLSEGRGKFLHVLAQIGPLLASVIVTSTMLNAGIPETNATETEQ